jgi:RimJ/RimL family protein N-acetyltransferase
VPRWESCSRPSACTCAPSRWTTSTCSWSSTRRPTPRAEIEGEFLPAWLTHYELYAGYGFWAAIEQATGSFLGWFHFRPAPGAPADEPELGYRLRRAAWGQGFATEGSRALIDRGFGDYGVRRVVAETMAVNVASRRVMEKAGLRLVRSFHQDWPYPIEGSEHGDVEYALTRAEWLADRAAAGDQAEAQARAD